MIQAVRDRLNAKYDKVMSHIGSEKRAPKIAQPQPHQEIEIQEYEESVIQENKEFEIQESKEFNQTYMLR